MAQIQVPAVAGPYLEAVPHGHADNLREVREARGSEMTYRYVVAASQNEADQLFEYGWNTRTGAESHLKECREPPTDPFYGNKLHIYRVAEKSPKL